MSKRNKPKGVANIDATRKHMEQGQINQQRALEQQIQFQMELQKRQQQEKQVKDWEAQLENIQSTRMKRSQDYADVYVSLFINTSHDLFIKQGMDMDEALKNAKIFADKVRTIADSYTRTIKAETPQQPDLDHIENVLKRYISAAQADLNTQSNH